MSESNPTRAEAEAEADRLSLEAIRKAVAGDADGARAAREKADLAKHLLKGQHD